MRHLFAANAAAFLLTAASPFADPVGSYSVVGNNPGSGSKYRGTVTVEKNRADLPRDLGRRRYPLCRHRQ